MKSPRRVLVVQTAFLGDVVLTLPLVQVIHRTYPETEISFLATPRGAEALHNHPAIHSVVVYDKRGAQRGIRPLLRLVRWLKSQEFDVALVPHRSFRSALLVWLTGIPVRIGFDTSAGAFMFTRTVPYVRSAHEVSRNFAFLTPLEIGAPPRELPELYPSSSDVKAVDEFLKEFKVGDRGKIIALSPGSAWNTKRWPSGRFAELAKRLRDEGVIGVLIGGKEDVSLCEEIATRAGVERLVSAAGRFSILQSAEFIRRCKAIVTNDSAPLHLAVAMRTPVIAIFGATVPAFGFGPLGDFDAVVQTEGLACRPCSIHGGDTCPIGTFECMERISAEMVRAELVRVMQRVKTKT